MNIRLKIFGYGEYPNIDAFCSQNHVKEVIHLVEHKKILVFYI